MFHMTMVSFGYPMAFTMILTSIVDYVCRVLASM